MRLLHCTSVWLWFLCASAILFSGIGPAAASAATLTVCASGCGFEDFQAALDAAQPGDTILLRAGETFVGHFRLPVKSNPSGAPIVIRSDAPDSSLPSGGTRLVPHGYPGGNTELSRLPRLVGRGNTWRTTPVIGAEPGAHHYVLQFLNIDGVAQQGWETLMEVGNNSWSQASLDAVPHDIVLDRLFIHGHQTKGQKRCLSVNGRNLEVRNSYIVNCMNFALDSQAIASFNGPGPLKIINNYLEATGENILIGGADPTIYGLVPADIEIRGNHFTKPLAWREPILGEPGAPSGSAVSGGVLGAGMHYFKVVAIIDVADDIGHSLPSPEHAIWIDGHGAAVRLTWQGVAGADRYRIYMGTTPDGQDRYIETAGNETEFVYAGGGSEVWAAPGTWATRWNVKNLLELKNAERVTIDGNFFDHLWPASQNGYAILFTPRNEDGRAPWSVVRDIVFANNILCHMSGGIVILGEDDIRPSQRTGRITIRNNLAFDMSYTWGGTAHFLVMTRSPYDVKIDHNSIFHDGMVVLVDDGVTSGFQFTNNVLPFNDYGIFGSGAGTGNAAIAAYFPDSVIRRNAFGGGPAGLYPSDNLFPDLQTFWSQFVAPNAADFRLVSGSSFRGTGTDGRDLGVDFAELNAATAGAVSGVSEGGPSGDHGSGDGGGTGTGGEDSAGGGNVGAVPVPFSGSAMPVPGLVEAENFDRGGPGVAYLDATPGNAGGEYRNGSVDIEPSSDDGGGYNVGWISAGEWLAYTVDVTSPGTYGIEFRVASSGPGGTFHLRVNGADVTGPLTIPDTGGWQSWTTLRSTGLNLAAGQQVWTVVFDNAGPEGSVGNLNYIRAVPSGGSSGSGSEWAAFSGTPAALPGLIEAENFDHGEAGVAYHDTSWENAGGAYRDSGVDLERTGDSSGDFNIGWLAASEWLNYSVQVFSGGAYDLEVRVASSGPGGSFHLEFDGVDMTGAMWIPDTGGWQTWTTIRRSGVTLPAGVHLMRLVIDSNGPNGWAGNVNWIRAVPQGASPGVTTARDIVLYASDVTAVSGNWARVGSWSGADGQKMQSEDYGAQFLQPLASPSDYFEMQFVPEANTPYRLWMRLRGAGDDTGNDSVWVQFSGAVSTSESALWPIGSGSALLIDLENCWDCGIAHWGWNNRAWWLEDDAIVRFPSALPQRLRIQTREDGVQVDQVVLSPVTYFNRAPGELTGDTVLLPKE